MVTTIELPDELARSLAEEAAQVGLSLPDYTVRLLVIARSASPSARTGKELVEYWKSRGLIGTLETDVDSPELARRIRHAAETRFEI